MWNLLCLIAVSLVVESYQRAPVLASTNNHSGSDSGALWPSAFVDDADHRWRQHTNDTEGPADVEPADEYAVKKICPQCTCGIRGKRVGIIGGKSAYINEYPWMALLLIDGSLCGGSLINDRYVMTAAHCVIGENKKNMIVRLLEYDRSTTNELKSKEYKVLKVIMHENYVSADKGDDIALLRLAGKVIFRNGSKIRPVCLPARSRKSYVGYQGVVIGWGRTKPEGSASNVLQEVNVPIISNEKCNALYSGSISDGMLCAGQRGGGKDACQGDSGGPLHIVQNQESYHVVGIVSWGIGCGDPKYPGVNTRVSKYLKWLAFYTEDACWCDDVVSSKNHK